MFDVVYNQLLLQIDKFQRTRSGWIKDYFIAVDFGKYYAIIFSF